MIFSSLWLALMTVGATALMADELPALPAPPASGAASPQDAALVVGIRDYRGLDGVHFAWDDARAFQSWLTTTRGVPAERVRVIEAGATFYMGHSVSLEVGYLYGSLYAVGTDSEPITFTSAADTPAAGDWDGIRFRSYTQDADTTFSDVTIEYAGNNTYGALYLTASGPTITDCTITDSSSYAIWVDNNSDPTISSNSYSSNSSGDVYYEPE